MTKKKKNKRFYTLEMRLNLDELIVIYVKTVILEAKTQR